MLELPHTMVGALIATKIPDPKIALPLALASHFWLDFLPHWNPNLSTEKTKYGRPTKKSTQLVVADMTASFILGSVLACRFWPNINRIVTIYLACFFAVIPDVIEGLYFFAGINHPWLIELVKFQRRHQGKAGKKLGLAIQSAVVLVSLFYLFS
jgi:hypothetical protein